MQQDNEPNNVSPEKSLVDYFYLFVEKLWLVAIFVVLGLIFANHEVSKIPTTYRSSATIEVIAKANKVQGLDNAIQLRPGHLTVTIAQKLSLNSLYERIVESEDFKGYLPRSSGVIAENQKRALIYSIKEATTVRLRPNNSPLIDISVTHTNRELAKDVIAIMLREYQTLGSDERGRDTDETLKLLTQQKEASGLKLAAAQRTLGIYKDALELRELIRDSERKISELEKKYLDRWPPLVRERGHKAVLVGDFVKELNRVKNRFDVEKQFWDQAESVVSAGDEEELLTFRLQTAEARNSSLNRDFDSESKLYKELDDRLKLGTAQSDYRTEEISVLEQPVAASGPVPVNKPSFFLKFGMLGAAIGMAISFLLGSLDTRIRRIEDLEKISNTKVLAAVPKSSKLGKGMLDRDQNIEYESIRTLHTNSLLNAPDAKVVLVTSSTPSEGKSTISTNLAAASASWGWGEKVLLIDFDLRKPRVHEYMGLAPETKGVGDYLIAKDSINECIAKHPEVPDLYVMVGGSRRFDGGLPDVRELEKMLDLLKGSFDRIIVDSAPILAVSDTLVLSKHVDEVLLVFRMWKTPRKALIRTLTQLSQNDTYPYGVVANYMPTRLGFGRHNYYYSYAGTGYSDYSTATKPGK